MKRYTSYIIASLCLVFSVLAATSCRDRLFLKGKSIAFAASSKCPTRAEYSNAFFDDKVSGQEYERIDWQEGDKISIYSPQAFFGENADVQGGTSSVEVAEVLGSTNKESKANVGSPEPQVTWGEDIEHQFYAVYPAPGTGTVTQALGDNTATGLISANQSAGISIKDDGRGASDDPEDKVTYEVVPDLSRYMMMTAWKSTKPTDDPIDLQFTPLTTCVDFTIKNGTSDKLDIKSISLSASDKGGNYSGGFTYKFSDGSCEASNPGNKVFLEFNQGDIVLGINETLRFRLFINPSNDIVNPVFTIEDYQPEGHKYTRKTTIKPKSGDFTIKKGHKQIITGLLIPDSASWTTFDKAMVTSWETVESDLGVESEYRYVLPDLSGISDNVVLDAAGGEKMLASGLVSYKVHCADKDTKIGVPPVVSGLPDWVTANVTQTVSDPPTYEIKLNAKKNPIEGVTESVEWHTNRLKNATSKGTSAAPYDLSKCNPATGAGYSDNAQTTTQSTANCYVVDAPGYYSFPLVYGNAIKNGATNEAAYKVQSGISYVLTNFVNYTNNNPSSHTGMSDLVKFHSITSPYIKTDVGSGTFTASIVWEDASGQISDLAVNENNITFKVNKDKMQQSNAIIALKKDGTIVWSWHIWVTDEDLSSSPSTHGSIKLMCVNLGWCATDDKPVSNASSSARSGSATVSIDVDGVTPKTVQLDQQASPTSPYNVYPSGTCTYYQWGRKDPLCSKSVQETTANATYGIAISNPGIAYMKYDSSNTLYGKWLASRNSDAYNLWNIKISASSSSYAVNKTIYDPCPVGFAVPRSESMKTLTGSATEVTDPFGYVMYGLYFPAKGDYNVTTKNVFNLELNGTCGLYWSDKSFQNYKQSTTEGWGLQLATNLYFSNSKTPFVPKNSQNNTSDCEGALGTKVRPSETESGYAKMLGLCVRPEFE